MRIAMLYPSPVPKGGPYVHLTNIKRELEKMGHEVWVPRFTKIKRLGRLGSYAFNLLIVKNFNQINHEFDIVHCMSGGGASFSFYREMGVAKTPLVTTYHGSWRRLDSMVRQYGQHIGIKYFFTWSLVHPMEEMVKNWELTASDRVLAVSDYTKRVLVEDKGLNADKINVCYNGVNRELFLTKFDNNAENLRNKYSPDTPMVLYVGDLIPRKGTDFLIEAIPSVLRETSKVKFVFVGSGNWKSRYVRLARELGVSDAVVFTGYVPRSLLASMYSACDVFAFPTLMDAFGLVAVEAMACGKPVVASKVGGIPEIVQHRKTGILVKPGDAESLAKAIIELTTNPKLAKQYGREGRKVVMEKFTWEAVAERVLRAYDKTLNEARTVD